MIRKPISIFSPRRRANTVVSLSFVFCGLVASLFAAAPRGGEYDPLAKAIETAGVVNNLEAPIPPQCYTKTDGISNPCWTCHTIPVQPNYMLDWELQVEYAFSDFGLVNRWNNLFVDRSNIIGQITDEQIQDYISQDNYTMLREALIGNPNYPGFVPDLDFYAGWDDEGFAYDGSDWRAIRFKSFLGTFWPTNGNRNDVAIRLPEAFRQDAQGNESREIYKVNLAILEAAMTSESAFMIGPINRVVEPIDESLAGTDLNDDGQVGGTIHRIINLPSHYVGGASNVEVARNLYPQDTEFLHTVRYVDPQQTDLASARMKEVRYARKFLFLDFWAVQFAYEQDQENRDNGVLPQFTGDALTGISNDFGWRYQAFIEDEQGRLRLQTDEETRFCMGCHGAIGVSVDHSFAFPRKVPGFRGWRFQDVRGIPDVPQVGHNQPETLTYFQRVQAGDEFRANDEILNRFFPNGELNEAKVQRAAVGGDQDLFWLVAPTPERALLLAKAYRALVMENSFELGRDGVAAPLANVFPEIEGNGSTELADSGLIFFDGRLHLDWSGVAVVPGDVDGDDDADPADWLVMATCLGGPDSTTPAESCGPVQFDASDQDGDKDVDLEDFALYSAAIE